MIQKSSVAEDVSSLILFLRGLQKSELLLGLAWAVGGKLFLDLLEPFDEDFHRRSQRDYVRGGVPDSVTGLTSVIMSRSLE